MTYVGMGRGGTWELLMSIAHQDYTPNLKVARNKSIGRTSPSTCSEFLQKFLKDLFI